MIFYKTDDSGMMGSLEGLKVSIVQRTKESPEEACRKGRDQVAAEKGEIIAVSHTARGSGVDI